MAPLPENVDFEVTVDEKLYTEWKGAVARNAAEQCSDEDIFYILVKETYVVEYPDEEGTKYTGFTCTLKRDNHEILQNLDVDTKVPWVDPATAST